MKSGRIGGVSFNGLEGHWQSAGQRGGDPRHATRAFLAAFQSQIALWPLISPALRRTYGVSSAQANAADGFVSNTDKLLQQAQMMGLVYAFRYWPIMVHSDLWKRQISPRCPYLAHGSQPITPI